VRATLQAGFEAVVARKAAEAARHPAA